MNAALTHRPDTLPLTRACHVLGLSRGSIYAHQRRSADATLPKRSRKESSQPRALSPNERAHVLATLHSDVYCDQPPTAIY